MNIWRVLVSHPKDTQGEVRAVEQAIRTVNEGLEAGGEDVRLQRYGWERDVLPGAAETTVQQLIESKLRFDEAEIVVGIFWMTLGTPVADVRSGTVRELEIAYNAWKSKGSPHLLIYFNKTPMFPNSEAEAERVRDVLAYEADLKAREIFVQSYSGEREFERLVTRHLNNRVKDVLRGREDRPLSPFVCRLTTSPVDVRSEGLSERVGDIMLRFELAEAVSDWSKVKTRELDLEVYLTTKITRPREGPPPQILIGNEFETEIVEGTYGEGVLNSVRFENVRVRPFRDAYLIVTGLRADAGFIGASGNFLLNTISVGVKLSEGAKEVPVEGNGSVVAFVRVGLVTSVQPNDIQSLASVATWSDRDLVPFLSFVVRFREGFVGAFKSARQEAGLAGGPGWPSVQLERRADAGTRFAIMFPVLPADVSFYVTVRDGRGYGVLIQDAFTNGSGGTPYRAESISGPTQASIQSEVIEIDPRRRLAVWEWTNDEPPQHEKPREFDVAVLLIASKDRAFTEEELTVVGNFAPFYTSAAIRLSAHVPCFAPLKGYLKVTRPEIMGRQLT